MICILVLFYDYSMFDKNKLQSRLYSRISKSVEKALDEGADPNKRAWGCDYPLHHAVCFNRYKISSMLIKAGASINIEGIFGLTPLHYASMRGSLKLVKLLVKNGADINAVNDKLKTALDLAIEANAYSNRAQVISFLLTLKRKQQ